MCACVHACVRACVRACVCVHMYTCILDKDVHTHHTNSLLVSDVAKLSSYIRSR